MVYIQKSCTFVGIYVAKILVYGVKTTILYVRSWNDADFMQNHALFLMNLWQKLNFLLSKADCDVFHTWKYQFFWWICTRTLNFYSKSTSQHILLTKPILFLDIWVKSFNLQFIKLQLYVVLYKKCISLWVWTTQSILLTPNQNITRFMQKNFRFLIHI